MFTRLLRGLCLSALLCACSSAPTRMISASHSRMPHPASFDLASLHSIFQSTTAPQGVLGEFADRCDEDFSEKGATQLVQEDAERMHWCFYAKIFRLQEDLQEVSRWKTRQDKVKNSFQFLSPIALAFLTVKKDAHYSTWEKQYHDKIASWVFFEKKSNRAPASIK